MHASAYRTAQQFFQVYGTVLNKGTVLEIGSRQVAEAHRTLRSLCPPQLEYIGADLDPGLNVDLILPDPYRFPLTDSSVDVVICTSVFEHSAFFWQLFEETLRVLKPGGVLYVNAPSNGYVHRYPIDSWRFYPDSGMAMAQWGRRKGYDVTLLESFISDADLSENVEEIWNDFVAVFLKGQSFVAQYPSRMIDSRTDYSNARRGEDTDELRRPNRFPGRSHEELSRLTLKNQIGEERVRLYQIAYSDEILRSVSDGLLALDNRSNERPDWAEYWPIRQFLLNASLNEETLYGFLSPRLSEKLLFPADTLVDFVSSVGEDVDVASFSPYFDIRAVFANVFEQAEFAHPGMLDLCKQVFMTVAPEVDVDQLVNTSVTGIFCNYFAAKPRFWRQWLALGEKIFAAAETTTHPCSALLNRGYYYRGSSVHAKVFIIERLASALLGTTGTFKIEKFSKSTLTAAFDAFPYALFASMDTLKTQALMGHPILLQAYRHIQQQVISSDGVRQMYFEQRSRERENGFQYAPSAGFENWIVPTSAIAHNEEKSPQIGLGWLIKQLIK